MPSNSASKSQSPWSTWPWWSVFFTKFEKEATRRQSTLIKIYGLLPIILLFRLVPRYCWLDVALGQTELCHGQPDAQRFCFCCLMCDAQARKRFLIDLRALFWQKGAPTLDFGEILLVPFSSSCIDKTRTLY
jgi:hypothetical protein